MNAPPSRVFNKQLNLFKTTRINASELLQFQGVYLYDKGENDELFHVFRMSSTDLQVYYNTSFLKCKEKFKKKFFCRKIYVFAQFMLKTHKFSLKNVNLNKTNIFPL